MSGTTVTYPLRWWPKCCGAAHYCVWIEGRVLPALMNVLASHRHHLSYTTSVQKTHSKALAKHMEREQEYKDIPVYLRLSLHVCVHEMCVLLSVYADCDMCGGQRTSSGIFWARGDFPPRLKQSLFAVPYCVCQVSWSMSSRGFSFLGPPSACWRPGIRDVQCPTKHHKGSGDSIFDPPTNMASEPSIEAQVQVDIFSVFLFLKTYKLKNDFALGAWS